ncbi:MAG: sterol-binding protein [Candidatus Competibacteraceae bacterium]|nr:sterol-binding protein [Candidatus Competibacteraceae bacterium]
MKPALLMTGGLEQALNYCLRLDPEILPKLAVLSGKVIAMEVVIAPPVADSADGYEGVTLAFFLHPSAQGIQVTDRFDGQPDVFIRGTPLALARQFKATPGTLDPAVQVRGDTQVGKAFQGIMAAIDVDWEEQLSHWVGDTAAHQVGNTWRELTNWGRQVLDTLLQDAGEYFKEETQDLPPSGALAEFLDAVDTLRNDVDRLEARIRRLQQSGELGSV